MNVIAKLMFVAQRTSKKGTRSVMICLIIETRYLVCENILNSVKIPLITPRNYAIVKRIEFSFCVKPIRYITANMMYNKLPTKSKQLLTSVKYFLPNLI